MTPASSSSGPAEAATTLGLSGRSDSPMHPDPRCLPHGVHSHRTIQKLHPPRLAVSDPLRDTWVAGLGSTQRTAATPEARHVMSDTQTSGPVYQVVNPATGTVVETFDYATDEEIESTLAAVHSAYAVWRDVPIAERAKVVKRIGELFAERQDELGAIATEEMGKPLVESQGRGRVLRRDLRLLRDRGPRARSRPADQDVLGWQGHGAEAAHRAAAGDHAVELPLLPDRPVRGTEPDAGQHHRAQARRVGAEVRARGGADHEGRRSARGCLRQRVRDPRPDRADHRRPAHRRCLPDRF